MKALSKIHVSLIHLFQRIKSFCMLHNSGKAKVKHAYIIGTPEHDNIGDHAIALSEYQFLNNYFKEYTVEEIPIDRWREYTVYLRLNVKPDDLLFITGGGNMGSVYLEDEKLKRYIISKYPNNHIIIFPQTINYLNDKFGKKQLKKMQVICSKHSKLLIIAREIDSYKFIIDHFPNNKHFCCPDMAFYLKFKQNYQKRKGIGICLRNDMEGKLEPSEKENIIKTASERENIYFILTAKEESVSQKEREKKVNDKLNEISKFKVVITDRLHGMIFSIITSTPCYVLPISNHKIISTLKWNELKESVKFYDINNINMVFEKEKAEWNRNMDFYFTDLAKKIREFFNV